MGRGEFAFPGAGALVLTLLLLAAGTAPNLSPGAPSERLTVFASSAAASGVHAYVTWDGVNTTSATSASAALSTNFASTIQLKYHWSSASLYNISDARLQMFYFGFALSTRDVLDSNPIATNNGTFTMTWQAGALDYLLEGTYRLTATLLTPGGASEWSQSFYIRASAPLNVLAAIPIILILIAIYEIYGLLTAGRTPSMAKPPKKPAKTPPSEEPETTGPPTAEEEKS